MFQLSIADWTWVFSFGLLHTLQPCEDKAIFGFHTFGVAKNNQEAIKIVIIYSLGLFATNAVFGFGFSFVGTLFGWIVPWIHGLEPYFSAITMIMIGAILYYRLVRYRKGDNHVTNPVSLKVRKNLVGTFLLGVLTGLPPCPFELTVYIRALGVSAGGLGNGLLLVFWFAVGTIFGMIILTIIVTSFKKLDIFKERNKDVVQRIALWILIGFGLFTLGLALFGVRLYPIPISLPGE
ncbi:MAG: sulfite exporter TauE/SafE family protein [Candidatus Lokiarchaeota archaeon]|nr:sulfite exporter TauE/SafE family protein [Candidatus Lokiarchaeota archaeon]